MKLTKLLSIFILISTHYTSKAQYYPAKTFAPDFYSYKGDEYRSANGQPGPNYWQNTADYHVIASFDTTSLQLKGRVEITYCNNSPDILNYLWLQLDQNNSLSDARANLMTNPTAKADPGKGYQINNLSIWKNGQW